VTVGREGGKGGFCQGWPTPNGYWPCMSLLTATVNLEPRVMKMGSTILFMQKKSLSSMTKTIKQKCNNNTEKIEECRHIQANKQIFQKKSPK